MSKTFVELCLSGKAALEEIDAFVEKWHQSDAEGSISAFLGFTPEEYAAWVERPEVLRQIISARKKSKNSHTF